MAKTNPDIVNADMEAGSTLMAYATDHRGGPQEIGRSDMLALDLLRLRDVPRLLGISARDARQRLRDPLKTRVKRAIKRILKRPANPGARHRPKSQLHQYFGTRLGGATGALSSI
jgi:hypothetical protein